MAKKKTVSLSKNEKAANKAGISLKDYKASKGKKSKKNGSGLPSFSFDASKYLPGIASTASSIFDPQIQTLGVNKRILDAETGNKKATTKAEFAAKLRDTVESINRRGGFFSGGAIKNENALAEGEASALANLDLENLRGTSELQGKAGEIYGKKTQYMTDQLEGKQSFAYRAFQDSMSNYFRQANLGLAQSRLASDNAFKQANYDLNKTRVGISAANSARASKGSAYIDSTGKVVELPSKYNYVGGLSQLTPDDGPLF